MYKGQSQTQAMPCFSSSTILIWLFGRALSLKSLYPIVGMSHTLMSKVLETRKFFLIFSNIHTSHFQLMLKFEENVANLCTKDWIEGSCASHCIQICIVRPPTCRLLSYSPYTSDTPRRSTRLMTSRSRSKSFHRFYRPLQSIQLVCLRMTTSSSSL